MKLPGDLSQRRLQAEVMDQPDLEASRHHQALAGLARVNRFSASAGILWPAIRRLATREPDRVWRVLDVASGAGDVPAALWKKARRAGLRLEIEGCDISERAIEHARRRGERNQVPVRYFRCDALKEDLPDGYDVVVSSLFLHHLPNLDAIELLRRMGAAAGQLVLVNDLVRSYAGFVLAYWGIRLLSRCDVAHIDAPRSVEGAFRCDEALHLCTEAGLHGATVEKRWPCRYLIAWHRP